MAITPLDIRKMTFPQKLRGFDPEEVERFLALVAEELTTRLSDVARLEQENRHYQQYLEDKVETRTDALLEKHRSLQKLYINTVEAIVRAIEAKDPYTVGHSKRVTKYCYRMADKMGVNPGEIHDIEVAGLLHDVGKIGVSDAILTKPSRLTIEEYESIKEQPLISLKIIALPTPNRRR